MDAGGSGYPARMSDVEKPPPDDADRSVDFEEDLDPEAPTDSPLAHPPREDADRPVPSLDEPDDDSFGLGDTMPPDRLGGGDVDPADAFQEENAGSSLDQPSDQIS
jgi:hypothetical protein